MPGFDPQNHSEVKVGESEVKTILRYTMSWKPAWAAQKAKEEKMVGMQYGEDYRFLSGHV